MSTEVALAALADTVATYGFAYLITVGEGDHAHVVAVSPEVGDDHISVAEPGRRSSANALSHAGVTLVWPPPDEGGYSLIVDGTASIDGEHMAITASRAVLHRPAPQDAPAAPSAGSSCDSDCVELPVD